MISRLIFSLFSSCPITLAEILALHQTTRISHASPLLLLVCCWWSQQCSGHWTSWIKTKNYSCNDTERIDCDNGSTVPLWNSSLLWYSKFVCNSKISKFANCVSFPPIVIIAVVRVVAVITTHSNNVPLQCFHSPKPPFLASRPETFIKLWREILFKWKCCHSTFTLHFLRHQINQSHLFQIEIVATGSCCVKCFAVTFADSPSEPKKDSALQSHRDRSNSDKSYPPQLPLLFPLKLNET